VCWLAWTCAPPINRSITLKTKPLHATATAKKPSAARLAAKCVLRLFVAGATARSHDAMLRVRRLCAEEAAGSCTLEVIDIYQHPALARAHQIVATPTLVREFPRPMRRFIGNLANTPGLFSRRPEDFTSGAAA